MVASDEFWEDHNRLMMKKGNVTFPLQIKDRYGFPIVVRLLRSLGITPPQDHQRHFDQLMRGVAQWENEKKSKEGGSDTAP